MRVPVWYNLGGVLEAPFLMKWDYATRERPLYLLLVFCYLILGIPSSHCCFTVSNQSNKSQCTGRWLKDGVQEDFDFCSLQCNYFQYRCVSSRYDAAVWKVVDTDQKIALSHIHSLIGIASSFEEYEHEASSNSSLRTLVRPRMACLHFR